MNLPGATLSTPSVTEKDREDLLWALDNGLDYVGLSFVRSADDIRLLKKLIAAHPTNDPPWIVAKIESPEAIAELEQIVIETDAVMVARGDLGVKRIFSESPHCRSRSFGCVTSIEHRSSRQRKC